MIDGILWFFRNLGLAFYDLFYALSHPASWLDWSDHKAIMRVVYYGASRELFFVVLLIFLIVTAIGIWRNGVLWAVVRGIEGFGNALGRLMAWAGLLMVLQQVVIIFVQRIFAATYMTLGFGTSATFELSWWSEELKLYNAAIVCLCCAYTFVQGGHVRVDLVYGPIGYRGKKLVDMFGSLFFMVPSLMIVWFYAWFFLWRHLITPKVSASDTYQRLMAKAQVVRWNVETIGFSPNGFNGYFLFKVLMLAFCFTMLLQAVAFFYRSYLEFREGPESEGRYNDPDTLDDGTPSHGEI